MGTDTSNETIEDIQQAMRDLAHNADEGHVCILSEDLRSFAYRLHAAAERERNEWKERIKAGMEVADAFHKELTHVLDLICYRQQTLSPQKKKN